MVDLHADVAAFQEKFGFKPRALGARPSKKLLAFRLKFILEEVEELADALKRDDLAGVLDALIDLVYVAIGTAWLLNLPFNSGWRLVQAANMTKVRATDPTASKRGSDLDVVKPVGFVPPDIKSLLPAEDSNLLVKDASASETQLDLIDYINNLQQQGATECAGS